MAHWLQRTSRQSPNLIPYRTTNFGTPEGSVAGLYTPNELFFIRSNGADSQQPIAPRKPQPTYSR